MELSIRKAFPNDAETVHKIVESSIKSVYPLYYSKEIADLFLELHSLNNIRKDIESQDVILLLDKENPIGTGSFKGNHITRAFYKKQRLRN